MTIGRQTADSGPFGTAGLGNLSTRTDSVRKPVGQNEDDERYDNYDDDDDKDYMGSTRFVKAGSKTTIESVSMIKQND